LLTGAINLNGAEANDPVNVIVRDLLLFEYETTPDPDISIKLPLDGLLRI